MHSLRFRPASSAHQFRRVLQLLALSGTELGDCERLLRAKQLEQCRTQLGLSLAEASNTQHERSVRALQELKLVQRERGQGVSHLDVVQPLTARCAEAHRSASLEPHEYGLGTEASERREVTSAVAHERQAKVEATGQRHFTALTTRYGLASNIDDLDQHAVLQEHVPAARG